MELIYTLIERIQNCHRIVESAWQAYPKTKRINYKKEQVKHIYQKEELFVQITSYRSILNLLVFELTKILDVLEHENQTGGKINARVKTQNSIEQKIETYIKGSLKGAMPINKCLNDLFGVRIILYDKIEFKEIERQVRQEFPNLKCIDSSKNGYKAVHIYFSDSNFELPWELQIWNAEDESSNIALHKQYKQEYIKWENEFKGGDMQDG